MKKVEITGPEMKLVGITTRTNNAHIFSADPSKNPIAATVQRYFHNGLPNAIQNRTNPGTTYCAYTDYESDHTGDYTYFIGEEVSSFDSIPEGMIPLSIPAQSYVKFTNEPGPMPDVCIAMWQKIWQNTDLSRAYKTDFEVYDERALTHSTDLSRAYKTDFEVYDERALTHSNATLDIYIGVEK